TFLHPSDVGITPVFTLMNVMIFLLLGAKYWTQDMRSSLKGLVYIFSALVYINAVLLILYPEGLWEDPNWVDRGNPTRYLFGNQNQTGFVCFLAIATQCIYTFAYKKGYFNLILLTIISLVSVLFLGSMTSAIGIFLMMAYMLCNRLFKYPKGWLIAFAVIYTLTFTFIVWYGNDIEQIKWATAFIEDTLSKDTTFSKRTVIWANAVDWIKESPLVGYGIQNAEWNDNHLEGSGAHNLLVMLLLNGGFVFCLSFLYIVIYAVREALTVHSKATTAAVMSLCVLLVMAFFETYSIIYFFLYLQIIYYSASIPKQIEECEQTVLPSNE
ncbi:MAG: O-antigen ligase family protein, partial [Paludibacteraceae bacterium]|nr:O-antigen ligase family protein [Paludibacteraceae bacterium]